jgi:hypothetical protein
MPLQKAADFEDCSHDKWGTAPRCCTDEAGCVVCTAIHKRSLDIDDSIVKLTEDEEDDWHSLQLLGVQF